MMVMLLFGTDVVATTAASVVTLAGFVYTFIFIFVFHTTTTLSTLYFISFAIFQCSRFSVSTHSFSSVLGFFLFLLLYVFFIDRPIFSKKFSLAFNSPTLLLFAQYVRSSFCFFFWFFFLSFHFNLFLHRKRMSNKNDRNELFVAKLYININKNDIEQCNIRLYQT